MASICIYILQAHLYVLFLIVCEKYAIQVHKEKVQFLVDWFTYICSVVQPYVGLFS